MLNRADSQYESQSRLLREKQAEAEMHSRNDAQSSSRNDMHVSACRELTVGEAIDECICKAERRLKSLRDLKGNLPENFLNAGASRIRGLLET